MFFFLTPMTEQICTMGKWFVNIVENQACNLHAAKVVGIAGLLWLKIQEPLTSYLLYFLQILMRMASSTKYKHNQKKRMYNHFNSLPFRNTVSFINN